MSSSKRAQAFVSSSTSFPGVSAVTWIGSTAAGIQTSMQLNLLCHSASPRNLNIDRSKMKPKLLVYCFYWPCNIQFYHYASSHLAFYSFSSSLIDTHIDAIDIRCMPLARHSDMRRGCHRWWLYPLGRSLPTFLVRECAIMEILRMPRWQ